MTWRQPNDPRTLEWMSFAEKGWNPIRRFKNLEFLFTSRKIISLTFLSPEECLHKVHREEEKRYNVCVRLELFFFVRRRWWIWNTKPRKKKERENYLISFVIVCVVGQSRNCVSCSMHMAVDPHYTWRPFFLRNNFLCTLRKFLYV